MAVTKNLSDSARLTWVDAFVAYVAYGNANRAESFVDKSSDALRKSVRYLEHWLRRKLITDDKPPVLTDDGHDFLDIALEILRLSAKADLLRELSKTRVLPNGDVVFDGYRRSGMPARSLGKMLVDARADILQPYEPSAPVSAKDINMDWWDGPHDAKR